VTVVLSDRYRRRESREIGRLSVIPVLESRLPLGVDCLRDGAQAMQFDTKIAIVLDEAARRLQKATCLPS